MNKGRWLVWWLYVLAWSIALVVPLPNSIGPEGHELSLHNKFLIAKGLHLLAYAILAALTGWVASPMRYRWLLAALLMAHATVTELIQLHITNRTGQLEDVGLDHVGLLLGMLCTWKWWTAADPIN